MAEDRTAVGHARAPAPDLRSTAATGGGALDATDAQTSPAPPTTAALDDMIGAVILDYRIECTLGGASPNNAFGDIYEAAHVTLGTPAVVKLLKRKWSDNADIVGRFIDEARAVGRLQNPGIVKIFNAGMHRERAFLLMERLNGEPLDARVRRGKLAIREALVFARQATTALGIAHERGIVHRDVKPANLFLQRDPEADGGERVIVIDFGIAKLADGPPPNSDISDSQADVGSTKAIGTTYYMAPEQFEGSAIDGRADLYALGCVLFEMLTGRVVFQETTYDETRRAHIERVAPTVSSHRPEVPSEVDALVARLLAKRPADRYSSGEAVTAALAAVIGDLDAAARRAAPRPGDLSFDQVLADSLKRKVAQNRIAADQYAQRVMRLRDELVRSGKQPAVDQRKPELREIEDAYAGAWECLDAAVAAMERLAIDCHAFGLVREAVNRHIAVTDLFWTKAEGLFDAALSSQGIDRVVVSYTFNEAGFEGLGRALAWLRTASSEIPDVDIVPDQPHINLHPSRRLLIIVIALVIVGVVAAIRAAS